MNKSRTVAAACVAAGAALAPWVANAGIVTHDLSGGSQWRATLDPLLAGQWALGNFHATDGVAAWAPYGNTATTALNANHMMWDCGLDGSLCPGGGNGGAGPTEVFFGYGFNIDAGATYGGAAALIADDFFDLVVNGHEVLAATLDGHKDASGQPVALVVNLTPFLHEGYNVLALRAMDGFLNGRLSCAEHGVGYSRVSTNLGEFCKGNRAFEYMFVSGSVTVETHEAPEPAAWSLLPIALAALGWTRQRRTSDRG